MVVGNKRHRTARRPFLEAREYARSLHLGKRSNWRKWYKSGACPSDIPSDPVAAYKNDGWAGWKDWLT